jgi:uncharacterized protein
MSEPTVSVRGQAAVRAAPDEAFALIELTARDASPAVALADVVRRNERLVAILDELGIASADRSTHGLSLHDEFDHDGGRPRLVGRRATVSWVVRAGTSETVERVLVRAGDELDANIAGPNWQISAEHPAWLDAATRAAVRAREMAAAYAAGVGVELGPLISLTEPAVSGARHAQPMMVTTLARASAAAAGPMSMEPGEYEAVATIDATFALRNSAVS